MLVGISTYSLSRAMNAGEMTIFDVIRWAAENGAEQVELSSTGGYKPAEDPEFCKKLADTAKECGIVLSNYSVGASFMSDDPAEVRAEIERVKTEVTAAARMGMKFFRNDVAHFGGTFEQNTMSRFLAKLPQLSEGAAEVADFAAQYDITTSIENHGWFMNGSERVRMMVEAVNRSNFGLQIDVGNFVCVDEDPVIAVKRALPIASVVHFKDFYLRKQPVEKLNLGASAWFPSQFGTAICGSVVGWGDLDIPAIAGLIKDSGYDGVVSLEFEGAEECKMATKAGLAILKDLLK